MVGKANTVMSAFHILAACMAHVTNHGSVTAKKDGVAFSAIKVNLIIRQSTVQKCKQSYHRLHKYHVLLSFNDFGNYNYSIYGSFCRVLAKQTLTVYCYTSNLLRGWKIECNRIFLMGTSLVNGSYKYLQI